MKILPLGNSTIECSQKQNAYNTLRLKYQSLADNAKNDFLARFEQKFKDMDELHVKFSQVAKTYLEKPIDIAIRDLVEMEVFDVDDESFLEKYLSPHISLEGDFSFVDDKYMEIALRADKLEAYRNAKSSSGPALIGGGFGVEGAAKGIAAATAVNLFVGALSGIINAGTKLTEAVEDNREKSGLYNSFQVRVHLANIIWESVFQTHCAYIDVVRERFPGIEFENVSPENKVKSKAIFTNLLRGRIAEDRAESVVMESLRLNPYDSELYFFWLSQYGDASGDLEVVAQFYGIGSSLEKKMLEIESEERLLEEERVEVERELEKERVEFEEGRLTVAGISHDTFEEAEKTRKNYDAYLQELNIAPLTFPGDQVAREFRIIMHLRKSLKRVPTKNEVEEAKWDGVEL